MNQARPYRLHRFLPVTMLLASLATSGCVDMTPLKGGVLSTSYEQRFLDEAINRDWEAIEALRTRIIESRSKKSHLYAVARAEAELNLAVEEYQENDRTDILEPLLNDAQRLVNGISAGSVDLSLPKFPGVMEMNSDLLNLTISSKKDPLLLDCAGEEIAKLEIGMLELAHEEYEVYIGLNTFEHVGSYRLLVDHLADDLSERIASNACKPPVVKGGADKQQPSQASQEARAVHADKDVQLLQKEASAPLIPLKSTFPAAVLFKFDKCGEADMLPEGKAQLERFGELLLKYPDEWRKLVVSGHTDRLGRHKYNLGLSICRTNTVRMYLLKKFGIPPERIEARGMASTQPVKFCAGPLSDKLKACLQPNRRVEIDLK